MKAEHFLWNEQTGLPWSSTKESAKSCTWKEKNPGNIKDWRPTKQLYRKGHRSPGRHKIEHQPALHPCSRRGPTASEAALEAALHEECWGSIANRPKAAILPLCWELVRHTRVLDPIPGFPLHGRHGASGVSLAKGQGDDKGFTAGDMCERLTQLGLFTWRRLREILSICINTWWGQQRRWSPGPWPWCPVTGWETTDRNKGK